MSDKSIVTEQKLKEFYNTKVRPFLGGGGGIHTTVLYDNSISRPSQNTRYTFSDDITNYKMVYFEICAVDSGTNYVAQAVLPNPSDLFNRTPCVNLMFMENTSYYFAIQLWLGSDGATVRTVTWSHYDNMSYRLRVIGIT